MLGISLNCEGGCRPELLRHTMSKWRGLPVFRRMMRMRFGKLVTSCLTQGMSPRRLALTLALGAALGMLPAIWGSTLLCAFLAFRFRLNQAVIQAANYLVYPVQIALFVPFYKMGAHMFPWGPAVSVDTLRQGLAQDWMRDVPLLIVATLKALAAWLVIAPPLAAFLYVLVLAILRNLSESQSVRRGDQANS